MIKLLRVEIKKLFKKKCIYVIWGLILVFCLLNNILYKIDYDEDGNYKYPEKVNQAEEKKQLETELTKYNPNNQTEQTMFITILTRLEIIELKQQFLENSWQFKKINTYLYDVIYQINYHKYITQDKEQSKKILQQYNNIIQKLNSNDYFYFLIQEKEQYTSNKKELEIAYKTEKNEQKKIELKKQLEIINFDLKILNYRLSNNIKEDDSYLNNALDNYQKHYDIIKKYKNENRKQTHQEQLTYQQAMNEYKISKYILETKNNINKPNNLNYQLRSIIDDYEIFIVILIIMICSSIICEEFKDGTIKLLLIKPYSRGKILLSKYLAAGLIILMTVLLLIIVQIIVGGFLFGFESLKIPVAIYDFNKEKIVEYSIFQYMTIRIMAKIPFLLILGIITMFLSIITTNTMLALTMPLLLYVFNPTLIYMASQYKLEFMKYLVNINWNLEKYLFGQLGELSFINFSFSIIILIIYFLILLLITFVHFNKKNIKNI